MSESQFFYSKNEDNSGIYLFKRDLRELLCYVFKYLNIKVFSF